MNLLIVFTIFTTIFAWLLHRWRTRANISLALKVPSNRLHTWLGWGPIKDSKTGQDYLYNYGEKYGANSVCWMGPMPMFLTSDPKTMEDILKSKNCVNKPAFLYYDLGVILGDGLVTQPDPIWSQHRRIFDKGFTSKMLLSYTPVFHNEIADTIERIYEMLERKQDIDLFQVLKEITITIGMKTTLKRDCKRSNYDLPDMVTNFTSALTYAAEATFNQLMKVKILRYLAEITVHRKARQTAKKLQGVVTDSVKIIVNNDIKNPSYLPNLMTSLDYGFAAVKQNLLTIEELENNLQNLFAGSFETTSTSLYLVTCMLAMHPECQERAYNEIMSVLPNEADATLTYEQISQLSYLEMVINETMRLFPLVCLVFRIVCNESLKLSSGLTLPVGQILALDVYRLHRNEAVYGPEADRFNPENFSPENVAQRHPYAFLPFTKGQRFCIGWRYAYLLNKIFLAQLIRNFRFHTDFKFENLRIINQITTHLVEEPVINIEKREAKLF